MVSADHKDGKPVLCSPNDSRIEKSPLPWMSQPWSFLPNWASGCRPAPKQDPGGHGFWIDYNPVQYAYRTVGLIRGKHPYALVLDDIRKDDAEHLYSWLMQVDDDLQLAQKSPGDAVQSHAVDLVLTEKTPAAGTNRRLLVRMLAAGQSADEAKLTQAEAKLETYESKARTGVNRYQRLNLPLRSVTGHYLMLFSPHRDGQATPETAWSKDGKALSVSWADQKDVFHFTKAADGRTRCELAPEDRN